MHSLPAMCDVLLTNTTAYNNPLTPRQRSSLADPAAASVAQKGQGTSVTLGLYKGEEGCNSLAKHMFGLQQLSPMFNPRHLHSKDSKWKVMGKFFQLDLNSLIIEADARGCSLPPPPPATPLHATAFSC